MVDVRTSCIKPEGWEWVLGSASTPTSDPQACLQGARGGQDVLLTLKVGSERQGLPCLWILTDHLLEANLDDLDQIPSGEAALIPSDLIDGACGDMDSVSPFSKAQAMGGPCPVPHELCSAEPLHKLLPRTRPSLATPPLPAGSAILRTTLSWLSLSIAYTPLSCLLWPFSHGHASWHELTGRTDPSQHHCSQHRPGL